MNRKQFLATAAGLSAGVPLAAAKGHSVTPPPYVPQPGPAPKVIPKGEGTAYRVLGTEMTHKLTGADTYGQMMWLEDHNQPGSGIPPHVHTREDEVFRVLEGEVEFTLGDVTRTLKAGDVAFAPRYVPHSWRVVGDQPARTIMTAFPAGIEHMFSELGELPAGPPDLAKVAEICGRYGISFV